MSGYLKAFQKRLLRKDIQVGVVGLGYVGLPLALAFVKKGFKVLGIEIDKDRLQNIIKKKSYISDISDSELRGAINSGRFSAVCEFTALRRADVIIICVPTPLKRRYLPNISYIRQAVTSCSRNIKKGALIILESTTYPGTTDEVILPLLEKKGLRHGRDFYFCFSPERIDPGNKAYPVHKIPKVIGGANDDASCLGVMVYENIIDKVVCVSSARVAEAVKLLENTFRLINIGLIDELAMMAHKMKFDIWEVIKAASTKPFGFMPFYPGPGVGGHCIPKDPLYLYWKAKHFGFRSRFIKLASDMITYMPQYVVERLQELLEIRGIPFKKAKVLVVGVTYKKDIKDLRKSPSLDIISVLQKKKIRVKYLDPLIPYLKINDINLSSVKLSRQEIKSHDCVIIATDHTMVDYDLILKHARLVFDTRNVYKGAKNPKVVLL